MGDVLWNKACSVRLDQLDSEPDRQDGLCLLAIFDKVDLFRQGNLTKRQLGNLSDSNDVSEHIAAASRRFVANFDHVSHQIEPRDFPVASSVAGTFYLKESRVLSKPDLEKIVHDVPR